MPDDFNMQSMAHKAGHFEHEDIFQLLEEWEQGESRMTLPAAPFGSAPTQPSYLHPADARQSAAANASPYGPLLETPDAEYGVRQQSAPQILSLELHPEHLRRRATYPMAGPGPSLQVQPWPQQSPDASQQQSVPQLLGQQGD